ncbi:MAG: YggS family pyridoxal phosphate enzyme [Betaproteobacteria bacterium RIFCSPLOWO2_12_FULL_65_14]|nr:MAG: YggS family pyridoxal phosphate enzyme [Betaproteobacteria bacterium RIFCSPLOWO2_12_FULL_65_14]
MATIADNLQAVRARIARAAQAAGRDPATVTLLAVSKTHSIARIEEAQAAGQRAFGENYVQDALPKIDALPGLEWHLIGPLQSNKTRVAAERFDWVQTVDRKKIADRLSEHRPVHRPALNVLIQVNISAEPTKSGAAPGAILDLAKAISALPRLRLRGLMAIPRPGAVSEFSKLKQLFDELKGAFAMDTLSMGMSEDFEAAIAQGSTLVRVGTAIFGLRNLEKPAA